MKTLIEILKKTLLEEARLYEEYLPVSKEENKAIIHHDLEKVNQCLAKKELLICQAQEFEGKRVLITKEIRERLNLKPREARLSNFVKFLDEKDAKELKEIQERLKKTLNEVRFINRANNIMLQEVLKNINETFEQVMGKTVTKDEYNYSGKACEKVEVRHTLINQVA